MNGKTIVDDIERVLGKTINKDDGIILVDLGFYFPYKNQKILKTDFEFSSDLKSVSNMPLLLRDDNYVLNHRYPNHGYITASSKMGRKISKSGCFFVNKKELLNTMKYLTIRYGFHEDMLSCTFPISIAITKETPCACITVRVNLEDPNKPNLVFITHMSCGAGWKQEFYYTSEERYTETLNNGMLYKCNSIHLLQADMDKTKEQEHGVIVFEPEIKIFACTPDKLIST